ncbi:MAG: hypothetical protein ABIG43_01670, partial [Chloroflexota bacterium]
LETTPSSYYFPMLLNSKPFTTSYYMKTIDGIELYNMGCELGSRDAKRPGYKDNIVVLDFSYPICNGTTYGAELFGYGPVETEDIATAVENFGLGYYTCTGQDHDSTLLIGIGTNNKKTTCETNEKAFAHGAAWATMVNSVNQWFVDNELVSQVSAGGASDMELGFNGPDWTRKWVDGYDSVNSAILIHFGDAAGCPYDGNTWSCGTPQYPEWSVEDVWYVSYGAPPSFPIPLIYLTSGVHAKQWAQMSSFSFSQHGGRIDFLGAFTQSQACQQRGCINTDNTPAQAYQQMMLELGKDPNTAQELRFLTDIKWMWEE